jgi:hypothetical protein
MEWREALIDALWSGSVASVISTAVLAAAGSYERADAPRPLNGPSQWVWGKHAPQQRGFSIRYTVVGYLIHHAMSIFWATFFERFRPRNRSTAVRPPVLAAAAATSAAACLVDFRIVPERLSPGFERQLSRTALLMTYAAFAAGLAGAVLLARK